MKPFGSFAISELVGRHTGGDKLSFDTSYNQREQKSFWVGTQTFDMYNFANIESFVFVIIM